MFREARNALTTMASMMLMAATKTTSNAIDTKRNAFLLSRSLFVKNRAFESFKRKRRRRRREPIAAPHTDQPQQNSRPRSRWLLRIRECTFLLLLVFSIPSWRTVLSPFGFAAAFSSTTGIHLTTKNGIRTILIPNKARKQDETVASLFDSPRKGKRKRKRTIKQGLFSSAREGGADDSFREDGVTATLHKNGTLATSTSSENTITAAYENQMEVSLEGSATTADHNSSSVVSDWLKNNVFLGMDPTPDLLAIVTIYFVEGALGLSRLAQTYLLKDELSLGPAELSALTGIFVLPWTIKPIYGFLSDGFPLFGYRRKSYLIAAGCLGGLSYAALGWSPLWEYLGTVGTSIKDGGSSSSVAIGGTVAALMLSSACIALSDVVADGIVVTKTREAADAMKLKPAVTADAPTAVSKTEEETDTAASTAGGLQSLCWGASSLGALLSAYFSGSLLEIMSVRSVFGLTAVLPFLVALIALRMEEDPIVAVDGDGDEDKDNSLVEGVKEQAQALWQALKQPSIWRPALFVFLWQSTPTSDGAFFFFLSNDLHLGPEFLGRVRLFTAAASLGGIWVYQQYLRTVKIKDILFWSAIASFPLGLLPVLLITHANRDLGIPDTALIFGDDVALAALGEIAFLPILVLAARLCPPGIEAVLFATLMSIFNGASTVGTELGALLTKFLGVTDNNFDNLALLTVLCNVTSLYPLLLLSLINDVGDVSEEDIEKEEKTALNGNVAHVVAEVVTMEKNETSMLK